MTVWALNWKDCHHKNDSAFLFIDGYLSPLQLMGLIV